MFENFGEGFWVTAMFMLMTGLILCVAMVTGNEIAGTIVAAVITVLGMIAAFWFPTRGQTSSIGNQDPDEDVVLPL